MSEIMTPSTFCLYDLMWGVVVGGLLLIMIIWTIGLGGMSGVWARHDDHDNNILFSEDHECRAMFTGISWSLTRDNFSIYVGGGECSKQAASSTTRGTSASASLVTPQQLEQPG